MKLIHNTPISKRYSLGLLRKRTKTESEMIQTKRETIRRKETTESPEIFYCLWFLSLKLLLEMEKNGMEFTKGRSSKGLKIGKDIKIDKEFYKDWDLESVRSDPFWKWWKKHKSLFENPKIVDVNHLKEWKKKSEPHYRYLRIDTRTRYSNIRFRE